MNFNEDYYIYFGGNLEAQSRYITIVGDKNELFLCWRKHNGNEVYTNLKYFKELLIELDIYKRDTPIFSVWGYFLFLSLMAMLPFP